MHSYSGSLAAALALLCAASLPPARAGVPDWSRLKCEACEAVMDELQTLLANEHRKIEGRQDMDLLSRLDSKGKRQGKIVNYQTSELRAMEVLEELRKGIENYRVTEGKTSDYGRADKGGAFWFMKMVKYHDRGAIQLPGDMDKDMQRALNNFAGMLAEEYEDELSAIIRRPRNATEDGGIGNATVSSPMHVEFCTRTTGHCKDAAGMGWFRNDPLYKKVLRENLDEPETAEEAAAREALEAEEKKAAGAKKAGTKKKAKKNKKKGKRRKKKGKKGNKTAKAAEGKKDEL